MDHFTPEGTCAQRQNKAAAAKQKAQEENTGFSKEQVEMWGEPQVDSSGKVTTKLPPLPAMRYLTDPTPENAKAYVDWNTKRMEAIEKAQNLLQPTSGPNSPQAQMVGSLQDIKAVEFFFSPTCPYSIQQAPVIEGLGKKIGSNKVKAFTASGDPATLQNFIARTGLTAHIYVSSEPFKSNNIPAVPVTIIETKDGRKLRFDGFTESFIGQPSGNGAVPALPGQLPVQSAQGGKQCESK